MKIGPGTLEKERGAAAPSPVDPRQRALAFGLEFTKRCFEARTVDDVYLLLTNDLRGLIEFDRSILVVHSGGTSRLVATGNQPILEKKSKFYQMSNALAKELKSLNRGVLVSRKAKLPDQDLPESAKDALQSYLDFGGCSYLLCVPLNHGKMTLGHLLLEFMEDKVPDQLSILTLLNIAPFLAAAMAEKWLLAKKPGLL